MFRPAQTSKDVNGKISLSVWFGEWTEDYDIAMKLAEEAIRKGTCSEISIFQRVAVLELRREVVVTEARSR